MMLQSPELEESVQTLQRKDVTIYYWKPEYEELMQSLPKVWQNTRPPKFYGVLRQKLSCRTR